jgi:hypothetical protein
VSRPRVPIPGNHGLPEGYFFFLSQISYIYRSFPRKFRNYSQRPFRSLFRHEGPEKGRPIVSHWAKDENAGMEGFPRKIKKPLNPQLA